MSLLTEVVTLEDRLAGSFEILMELKPGDISLKLPILAGGPLGLAGGS